VILPEILEAISARGLSYRGAFHSEVDGRLTSDEIGTLVLLGFTGRDNWSSFATSPEAADGMPDALDRWSLRVISELGQDLDATAIFPFRGPPWEPFLRWAQLAEPVFQSPIGMLIHPDWGLWHAWRGALAFHQRFDLPKPDRRTSPCESCAEKPCLTACPVRAFTPAGYNVQACTAHISTLEGVDCIYRGCRARLACPVGAQHRYSSAQMQFHMQAFRKTQKGSALI
jgi:hypothetical protein